MITYAGIQVNWTTTSDRRWKDDIVDSPLGLEFLEALRPVDYFRKNDASKRRELGFIAQEVEPVLTQFGYKNSGMLSKDDKGYYSLRYNDLIAPIVKAIQELAGSGKEARAEIKALHAENKALRTDNDGLHTDIDTLTQRLNRLEKIK